MPRRRSTSGPARSCRQRCATRRLTRHWSSACTMQGCYACWTKSASGSACSPWRDPTTCSAWWSTLGQPMRPGGIHRPFSWRQARCLPASCNALAPSQARAPGLGSLRFRRSSLLISKNLRILPRFPGCARRRPAAPSCYVIRRARCVRPRTPHIRLCRPGWCGKRSIQLVATLIVLLVPLSTKSHDVYHDRISYHIRILPGSLVTVQVWICRHLPFGGSSKVLNYFLRFRLNSVVSLV